MKLFNEKMTSTEAQRVLFEYADAHRGENMEAVKAEYQEVARAIVRREMRDNAGFMTSYGYHEKAK